MVKATPLKELKETAEAYIRLGTQEKVADELGIHKDVVGRRIRAYHKNSKANKKIAKEAMDKIADNRCDGTKAKRQKAETEKLQKLLIPDPVNKVFKLPKKGDIKRYVVTSQQLSTPVDEATLTNLEGIARDMDATLLVSRYSYNINAYGKMSTKVGKADKVEHFWDESTKEYWCDDNVSLGKSLVFAGGLNISPSAQNPLSSLDTFQHRNSVIVPHARLAMNSVASVTYTEPAKLLWTTGSVTGKNYIQKKAGQLGEMYHQLGGLIVEVNHQGHWFVRQLMQGSDGRMHDLNSYWERGAKHSCNVSALQFGDIHAQSISDETKQMMDNMIWKLSPTYVVAHDSLSWGGRYNHHKRKNHFAQFADTVNGNFDARDEVQKWVDLLNFLGNGNCDEVVVPYSNHDCAIIRWLDEGDYRTDPDNRLFFLECELERTKFMNNGVDFYLPEWLFNQMRDYTTKCTPTTFMRPRGSKTSLIINKEYDGVGVEVGQHGHLGVSGGRGSLAQYAKLGRPINVGHAHWAGINGFAWQAGVMEQDQGYNRGLHRWSVSSIITHRNNTRQMITSYDNLWHFNAVSGIL